MDPERREVDCKVVEHTSRFVFVVEQNGAGDSVLDYALFFAYP